MTFFEVLNCVAGLASRGLQRPRWAQMSVFGTPLSDIIVIHHFRTRWTLPTCSNLPYTTLIPTIVCLVCPLEASRGPNEPKWVFSGSSQSGITVMYYSWVRVSPPTTAPRPLTKSDLLTLPGRWFRSKTIILSPFLNPKKKCIHFGI